MKDKDREEGTHIIKLGSACTVGQILELLGPYERHCPIRCENKGPIEVEFHRKHAGLDSIVLK
jgi:hypothetical protein